MIFSITFNLTFVSVQNKLPDRTDNINWLKIVFENQNVSLVGPSDSGKTYLIHEWLKVGTFQPKFNKIHFLYEQPQPF